MYGRENYFSYEHMKGEMRRLNPWHLRGKVHLYIGQCAKQLI
jgi:hypothetical protein